MAELARLAILMKQPVYKHFTKLRRNDFHRLASSASLATVATLTTKMGFGSIKTQTELNQSRNKCVTNKMGFSRVAVAGVQPGILCGSKGLGEPNPNCQAGLILDNRPNSKRRAGKDSPKRVGSGLGGAAPPVKRSATPLFGLHESVAVTLKARAQRGTRVGRRPKDALAYALRAGESRFSAAGRQVFVKDAKQDTCGGCFKCSGVAFSHASRVSRPRECGIPQARCWTLKTTPSL